MEIHGTITSRGDKELLKVWLDLERGGESINTLINFIARSIRKLLTRVCLPSQREQTISRNFFM